MRRGKITVALFGGLVVLTLIGLAIKPARDYVHRAAVRAALGEDAPPWEIGRALHFEVVDADTETVLPALRYQVGTFLDADQALAEAPGRFTHIIAPENVTALHNLIEIKADGYATRLLRINLMNAPGRDVPVRVALPRAAPFAGRLVDTQGDPVPDAAVFAWNVVEDSAKSGRNLGNSLEAVTDAEGRWVFADASPDGRVLRMRARPRDHRPDLAPARPEIEPINADDPLVLTLHRQGPYTGRIVDARGVGVTGARVRYGYYDGDVAVTDAEGRFAFTLWEVNGAKSRGHLDIEAEGFTPRHVPMDPDEWDNAFQLALAPGQALRLRLQDTSGQPLANARVVAQANPGVEGGYQRFNANAGADGVFVIADAPEGAAWQLDAHVPGRRPFNTLYGLKLTPGGEETALTFRHAGRVAILAVDARTGAPIDPVYVTPGEIRTPQWGGNWPQRRSWRDWIARQTGLGGGLHTSWYPQLRVAAPGVYKDLVYAGQYAVGAVFRLDAPGYRAVETPPVRGNVDAFYYRARMRPGETRRVRIVEPDGTIGSGARAVWLAADRNQVRVHEGRAGHHERGLPVVADAGGWLQLTLDAESDAVLMVQSDQGMAFKARPGIADGGDLALEAWARLEGEASPRIAALGGQGARLQWSARIGGVQVIYNASAALDAGGRFVAERLPPGTHRIDFLQRLSARGGTYHIPWASVHVGPGETAETRIVKGRAVTARLWLLEGAIPSDAALMVHSEIRPDELKGGNFSAVMRVDADGVASIPALPPGRYHTGQLTPLAPRPDDAYRRNPETTRFEIPDGARLDAPPLDLGVIRVPG